MRKVAKFEFTLSGFIIALLLVGAFASTFSIVGTQLESEYNIDGELTLGKYNQTASLIQDAEDIREATQQDPEEGVLDVIGGYFRAGKSALMTAATSVDLFGSMMDDASEDIEGFEIFKTYLFAIILIAIFVGVIVTAYLKMRV
jgi:hypothetical protein